MLRRDCIVRSATSHAKCSRRLACGAVCDPCLFRLGSESFWKRATLYTGAAMTITRTSLLASRRFLLLASGSLALSALACNKPSAPAPAASSSAAAPEAAAKPASALTVGFIYVGPKDDYGYNQSHAEGAKSLAALGVKIRKEEKVPETVDVQKTMESMINLD